MRRPDSFATFAIALLPALAAGQSVPQHSAATVEPYSAQTMRPGQPPPNSCASSPVIPIHYQGNARNGAYSGKMVLDLMGSGDAVSAYAEFSEGLTGGGRLTGRVAAGVLNLSGELRTTFGRWPVRLTAQVTAAGVSGNYELVRGGDVQRAEFRVMSQPVLAAIAGNWAINVPGAAYQVENDRGSYVERNLHVSPGAVAGLLVIDNQGQYVWNRNGAQSSGRLAACVTPEGQPGWLIRFQREQLFVPSSAGAGGFTLYNAVNGFAVYSGQRSR